MVALPSRTEGYGLFALEAISVGVPILLSGASGIAEALWEVEGGNTVIVESVEDANEWAEGARFKRLIENVMKTANGELNAFTFVSTQVCLYYMLYC